MLLMSTYTNLEQAVLTFLLDGTDPVLGALRKQFAAAKIIQREYTGVGFFLSFAIPDIQSLINNLYPVKTDFCFGDVGASIPGLEGGASFVLWVKSGYLHSLEAYTYAELWPTHIDAFSLFYLSGHQRQIDVLQQAWQLI